MVINVKLMKESAYETLNHNSKKAFQMIQDNPDEPSWLSTFVHEEPFENTTYPIEDFDLLYDEDYEKVAMQNGIILYEHLQGKIANNVLFDPHFWAWINFEKGYTQAQRTYELSSERSFEIGWVSKSGLARSIARGALSREFMKVRIAVDPTRENKYELVHYLFDNKVLYSDLCERSVSAVPNFSHAVLNVVKILDENYGVKLDRDSSHKLVKVANRIGSVMLIDDMSCEELTERILSDLKKTQPNFFKR